MKKYYAMEVSATKANVTIFGDITSWPWLESDVSSYNLRQELEGLDVDEIEVHINSYGGEVAEALAITNTLGRHKAKVTTYVDGFACSAATIIFMAGDRRVMSSLGNFLVHPAWSWASGNAADLRKEADNLDAITEQSITAYMRGITKSREELIDLMAEERFLTPEETLEWGFATEIEDTLEGENPTQSVATLINEKLRRPEETVTLAIDYDAMAKAVMDAMKAAEPKDPEPLDPHDPEPDPDTPKDTALSRFLKAFL